MVALAPESAKHIILVASRHELKATVEQPHLVQRFDALRWRQNFPSLQINVPFTDRKLAGNHVPPQLSWVTAKLSTRVPLDRLPATSNHEHAAVIFLCDAVPRAAIILVEEVTRSLHYCVAHSPGRSTPTVTAILYGNLSKESL